MFAVIATGGKQYLVRSGEIIKIEKLEAEPDKEIMFDKVLLLTNDDGTNAQIGAPYLQGVAIPALIQAQMRNDKIRVVKYKRKVRYRKVHGHRQQVTKVKLGEF